MVMNGDRRGISENGSGFGKTNSVFFKICPDLVFIPLNTQFHHGFFETYRIAFE